MSIALSIDGKIDWETPAEIFQPLHEEFNFDLDVCAHAGNAKVANWIGPRDHHMEALAEALYQVELDYPSEADPKNKSRWPNLKAKAYQAFCERIDEDALSKNWRAQCPDILGPVHCWNNCPYGRALPKWVGKSYWQAKQHGNLVVLHIPSRTDTKYWHCFIWDEDNHRPKDGIEIRFHRGRITYVGADQGAPFPSATIIFYPFLNKENFCR